MEFFESASGMRSRPDSFFFPGLTSLLNPRFGRKSASVSKEPRVEVFCMKYPDWDSRSLLLMEDMRLLLLLEKPSDLVSSGTAPELSYSTSLFSSSNFFSASSIRQWASLLLRKSPALNSSPRLWLSPPKSSGNSPPSSSSQPSGPTRAASSSDGAATANGLEFSALLSAPAGPKTLLKSENLSSLVLAPLLPSPSLESPPMEVDRAENCPVAKESFSVLLSSWNFSSPTGRPGSRETPTVGRAAAPTCSWSPVLSTSAPRLLASLSDATLSQVKLLWLAAERSVERALSKRALEECIRREPGVIRWAGMPLSSFCLRGGSAGILNTSSWSTGGDDFFPPLAGRSGNAKDSETVRVDAASIISGSRMPMDSSSRAEENPGTMGSLG